MYLTKIFLFVVLLTFNCFSCHDISLKASKSIEILNTSDEVAFVNQHKLLGRIMILSGHLLKYQTKFESGNSYHSFLKEDSCEIKEVKLIN